MTNASRFISNRLSELQRHNSRPIFDYQYSPTLTLEEAVETIVELIPKVTDYATKAKKKYYHSSLLTRDESAAIYLYTVPIPFFSSLNNALRNQDRLQLQRWYAFLQLFITALKKLPSTKATIWRGVNYDDTRTYVDDDIHFWWTINSCSMNPNSVQPYVTEGGTLFAIDAINGKDISAFSAVPDEQEIVLIPGAHLRRRYESLSLSDRFFVVHLEEVITAK